MNETAFHPEDKARSLIDRWLGACGWLIQSKSEMNLGAGLGVAVREFQTASGPVDYGLFVGRKLCGVIEAKAEGTTLSGYSEQASRYSADVPKHRVCARKLDVAKPSARAGADGDRCRQDVHRLHAELPVAGACRLQAHPVPC